MTALYGLPENVEFCSRCVMSNQRPNSCVEFAHTPQSIKHTIAFTDGVCDACRVAELKAQTDWIGRDNELRELCKFYRSRDGNFDCIVPGSGGKDSFYAAHVLRHRYGMHPLTVTWAAHLYTDVGWRNMQKWQAQFDNVLVTPAANTHRLLTRLALDNLLHPFQPFIVGQKAMAPRLAAQMGIPLVFYGENEAEYGDPCGNAEIASRSADYHKGSGNVYLSGVPVDALAARYGLRQSDLALYQPSSGRGLDIRYLGYYLRWHPQSCYYYAVEHGGFECAPERTPGTYSKYNSIDDKIDDLHYYTTWIKFGIGRATYDAAQEIRSGDITRDEGVALVRKYDGEYPARFEQEVFEYLSVPGLPPMTWKLFFQMCDAFKSPHLWDGERLRHVVA